MKTTGQYLTTGQYINHRCQYGIYCPVGAFDTPTHHYTIIYIYIVIIIILLILSIIFLEPIATFTTPTRKRFAGNDNCEATPRKRTKKRELLSTPTLDLAVVESSPAVAVSIHY